MIELGSMRFRHGRACPGHPRLSCRKQGVDAWDEPAHDALCGRRKWLQALLALLTCIATPAVAQEAPPPRQTLTIGYVEIKNDPRYEPIKGADRIVLKTRGHPYPAAEVSIDDARPLARVLPVDFALARITAPAATDVASEVLRALETRNIHFFLVDAPA